MYFFILFLVVKFDEHESIHVDDWSSLVLESGCACLNILRLSEVLVAIMICYSFHNCSIHYSFNCKVKCLKKLHLIFLSAKAT